MGLTDLLLILLIVVVLFGATRVRRPNDAGEGSPPTSRWAGTDWLLLVAAIVSCSVALVLPQLRR
jgi:hypothetical protein